MQNKIRLHLLQRWLKLAVVLLVSSAKANSLPAQEISRKRFPACLDGFPQSLNAPIGNKFSVRFDWGAPLVDVSSR